MKDVRKLVPRTPPEGLLEWAAGAKEELDEDVLLIETEWAEDFRLEVILDEWAQRKKVRAIRATCSACTESGLLWRSRDGRGDWGFLHPDSWTEGEGGAVCVDGDRTTCPFCGAKVTVRKKADAKRKGHLVAGEARCMRLGHTAEDYCGGRAGADSDSGRSLCIQRGGLCPTDGLDERLQRHGGILRPVQPVVEAAGELA